MIGFAGAEHTHDYYQLTVKKSDGVITSEAVDENATLENISIYPNPVSNGTLYVEHQDPFITETLHVQLFESLGNLVNNLSYTVQGGKIVIDTRNIEKGIYTLRISTGQKYLNKRIIVE